MENYRTMIREDRLSSYITLDEERFELLITTVVEAIETLNTKSRLNPDPREKFEDINKEDLEIFSELVKNFHYVRTIIRFFRTGKRDSHFVNVIQNDEKIQDKEKFLKLLYFFVFNCDTSITKIHTNHDSKVWIINSFYEVCEKFNRIEGEEKILFHGTSPCCVYSIIRTSLKSMSGTELMTNGAISGNGIYLSNDINVSCGYSKKHKSRNNFIIVTRVKNLNLVSDVLGQEVYVQQNDDVLPIGIITFSSKFIFDSDEILNIKHMILNKSIIRKLENEEARSSLEVMNSKRIRREIGKLFSDEKPYFINSIRFKDESDITSPLLIEVEPSEGSILKQDCEKFSISGILLELSFPEREILYPISPPILRVVKPRFVQSTGRISEGGSICIDHLHDGNWNPSNSLETLLISVVSVISNECQERNTNEIKGGRIDELNKDKEYSFQDYKRSFNNTAVIHKYTGWNG